MQMIFLSIFLCCLWKVETIKCLIGYGQRGLMFQNEISWTRTCPQTKYCFEAVTTDIQKVKTLIDYPWVSDLLDVLQIYSFFDANQDSYYSEYFVRSCGGDFGTALDYHPYRGKPKSIRTTPGAVKLNITAPVIITGHGGREQMDLGYICRRDLCSSEC